uniref:Myosin XIX n=1 Tax=Sander lucioperca TaxID=283035 RepID=A0A8D0CT27_SANLU
LPLNLMAYILKSLPLHGSECCCVFDMLHKLLLKCLQARYSVKVFYTNAGCTLVALNPFQPFPDLYSLDVMKEYHCAPQPQEFKPHIFIVAEEAYRNVQGQLEPVNQSLVVSGESGAGKTWTSRCLMKYYATVAASSSVLKSQDTVERIERRVLDSNPIMEAFGNACTLRNNNSSRFGKYIQLQLDRCQLLVGASVQTYLLEKTRVACQLANERNFHIFYQMMKGATDEQRKEWKMPCGQHFVWLPNSEKTLEEDCFLETVAAMVHLGINAERQRQIFKILAGILQLGNLNFSSSTDESQPCNLDEQSKDFLQRAAELLCVPAEELQMCFRVRTLKAGKQSVLKPCSQAECSMRRDCLAKAIYAQLFEWLVTFINNSICAGTSTWCNFIGVLDVYGFECFQINNLEQLCINYANEKLQQHFVAHYLRAQQEEYVSEGLEWSFVKYKDNQSCLDLLERSPVGVFSLLNEESRLNRASDPKTFRVRLEKELGDNANISWDKFSKEPHFTVAHYAGKVNYQMEGMVEKNKDPVPPELINLLQKSDSPLLHQIFTDSETENPTTKGLSKVTVVSKFKNSLESLMKILHSTTPHYTRCIKPNPDCNPMSFKKEEVIMQLEACGIVETIHISAAVLFLWQALLKSLAEAELDDAKDFVRADDAPALDPVIRERGLVQLSSIQEPVTVRGWPMGLALASAPSITMSMTATGFQKMMSVMASLSLPSTRGGYKVEPNQYSQGLASIRAQPKVRSDCPPSDPASQVGQNESRQPLRRTTARNTPNRLESSTSPDCPTADNRVGVSGP